MIKLLFRQTIRVLKKDIAYSTVNIIGLSVGLCASFLLLLFIFHELSYDRFFENSKKIYRIVIKITTPEEEYKSSISHGKLAPRLADNVAGLESVVRLYSVNSDIKHEHGILAKQNGYYCDSTFFQIFSFKVLRGNINTALISPNSLVITRGLAVKLFGTIDCLNNRVIAGKKELSITAIIENIPENSHLKFDFLAPYSADSKHLNMLVQQSGNEFYTYFKISENANSESTLANVKNYCDNFYRIERGDRGSMEEVICQNLLDIHLNSKDILYENEVRGDKTYISVFSILAVIILTIAAFNYINLLVAKSQTRYKEIAIKKVLGSQRKGLILQLIGESLLLAFMAFALALVLVEVFIQPFSELINRNINYSLIHNGLLTLLFFAVAITVGILSGLYPALFISSQHPGNLLKSQQTISSRNRLRVILLCFQFFIAGFLLISITIINNQVEYMRKKDTGFNKKNLLVINNFSPLTNHHQAIKEELISQTGIRSVTFSQSIPGGPCSGMYIKRVGQSDDQYNLISEYRVSSDFFKTFQIPLYAGRLFRDPIDPEAESFIINQTAARTLGLDNPLGEKLFFSRSRQGTVVGIVKDYHFHSIHEPIGPQIHTAYANSRFKMIIRFEPYAYEKTLDNVVTLLQKYNPDFIPDYILLDDFLNNLYIKEIKLNKLFGWGTFLALVLTILGLYALTSLNMVQQTKQIAIHKISGANTGDILSKYLKEILKWIIVSNLSAIPLAYIIMKKWLMNYPDKISIHPGYFLVPVLVIGVIAVASVFIRTLKTAKQNPAESLIYE